MAKTETVEITYKGSVRPNKTAFFTPSEIGMDFKANLDLVDSDIANAKAVQKAFQSEMEAQLKAQLAGLNGWLAEKDKLVSAMVRHAEDLKKGGAAADAAARHQEASREMARVARQLDASDPDSLAGQWSQMVADWATNAREQQGRVAMRLAVRAARVKAFNDKAFRVRSAQAAKGVLVVSVVAVGLAAFILSAGTAAPLVVGLHSAGTALSGLGSIAKFGVELAEDAVIEKKIFGSAARDVLTVRQALSDASAGRTDIAKHVTELRNLIAKREDTIRQLKADVMKYRAPAKLYSDQLATLDAAGLGAPEAARRKKAIDDVQAGILDAEKRIAALEDKNALAAALLQDLSDMVGDLGKLSTQPAETFLGNLKAWLGKPDEVAGLVATTGILTNAASGLTHR